MAKKKISKKNKKLDKFTILISADSLLKMVAEEKIVNKLNDANIKNLLPKVDNALRGAVSHFKDPSCGWPLVLSFIKEDIFREIMGVDGTALVVHMLNKHGVKVGIGMKNDKVVLFKDSAKSKSKSKPKKSKPVKKKFVAS